jgi:hypothetical protein
LNEKQIKISNFKKQITKKKAKREQKEKAKRKHKIIAGSWKINGKVSYT